MKFVNCIICGQNSVSFFKEWRGWTLVKCKNDGLIYVNPQPSEEEVSAFYNSGRYFKSDDGKFGYKDYLKEKKILMLNSRMFFKKIKNSFNKFDLFKNLTYPFKLLDIGTAYGFFMETFRADGFEVYGNDISKEAVSYARNHGLNVSLGSTKQQNYPSDFFDIVTMFGVIEHLNNPKEEMSEIARILKPGALLAVLTLNTSNFIGRGAIKPPEHLYYFSEKNLIRFLSLYGFKVVKIHSTFCFFSCEELIFHLFARIFESNKFFADKIEKFLLNAISVLRLNKLLNKIPIPVPDGQILLIAQNVNF